MNATHDIGLDYEIKKYQVAELEDGMRMHAVDLTLPLH